MAEKEGIDEAVILVKASPQISPKYGETVCCAGISLTSGEWLRLYPITFRKLEDVKQFGRWDHIRFHWRKPKNDLRPESCRVDQQSLEIIGETPKNERQKLLARLEVTGLNIVRVQGKSLALLRPKPKPEFIIEPKNQEDIRQEKEDYISILKQQDMFDTKVLIPLEPCPFTFKYQYQTDDRIRRAFVKIGKQMQLFLSGGSCMGNNRHYRK